MHTSRILKKTLKRGLLSSLIEKSSNDRWHKIAAYISVIVFVALSVNLFTFGFSPRVLGYTALVSSYTFYPFFLLSFVLLLGGRFRYLTDLFALLSLWTGLVWFIASSMFYAEHGRNLLLYELEFYYFESGYREYMVELFFSYELLAFTLIFIIGYFGFAYVYQKLINQKTLLVSTLVFLSVVMLWGSLESTNASFNAGLFDIYFTPASAPWSIAHRPYADDEAAFNNAVAKEIRGLRKNPFWAEGPDLFFTPLEGRYENRSVIVVMLESFRASDVAGFGEGAYKHRNLAPNLSKNLNQGVRFINYIESGRGTHTFRWGLMAGLSDSLGDTPLPYRNPDAGKIGRVPEIRALGYDCEILSAANPWWDNWGQLSSGAGCQWGLDVSLMAEVGGNGKKEFDFHDALLFDAAYKRYVESLDNKEKKVFIVQALSSHAPYNNFPLIIDDNKFPHDFEGAAAFTDYALGRYLEKLRALPQEKQPVIIITSDNAHDRGLAGGYQSGEGIMESMRVPGLLLLPDNHRAGEVYDGLFCHEDILDLMYLLIHPFSGMEKFLEKHRVVSPSSHFSSLLTQTTYFSYNQNRYYQLQNRWKLSPLHDEKGQEFLSKVYDNAVAIDKELWMQHRREDL